MSKIILFNRFIHSGQPMALVLIKEHKSFDKVELPHHHDILAEELAGIRIIEPENGGFLFGYFENPIESFDVLNKFKYDFFDWTWIDLEKLYENPIEYIQKGWWTEMDKEDFLLFIKNKSEILRKFDQIKSS